ncbi:MAG TPA: cysteine--tRNA ligase [Patescibacteria group bacterium]|jgi:cysteinyl-tRNA synthetase
MGLRFYNTLNRRKEPFALGRGKAVSMYVCGPTVYAPAQLGNLRSYVSADILRRWLEHGHGWKVQAVMNVTDIEDKILRDSQAKDLSGVQAFTKPHEERFFADLEGLGVERPGATPHATEHIGGMIKLIERIQENGFAYERDGSVYFDVAKYNERYGYGALQKLELGKDTAKHRIDNDEYGKESVQDFALWKAEPEDAIGWRSPWGHGRPGWHIECSAMAAGELGALPIDLHFGGVDLTFPHHENEIAQTKAATGEDLARFWVHGEHLLVDGKRMGKSEGNMLTLADVAKRGFEPVHLRMLFVQAHYRSKLNFTWESLAGAKESYERLQSFYDRLGEHGGDTAGDAEAATKLITDTQERFAAAMDDDLNTAEAVAAVFDLVRDGNALIDGDELGADQLPAVLEALRGWNDVLGVLTLEAPAAPANVAKLAEEREVTRQRDDFAEADRLRKQIERAGWTVEDTAQGPRLRKR